MSNPHQPAPTRTNPNSGARKGGAAPQLSAELQARHTEGEDGHPHGTDKGRKGGGEGSGVPPGQQTDHP
ncbi:hypothetical protein ACWDG1_48325 [Streptomyces sp. NPDC001177]